MSSDDNPAKTTPEKSARSLFNARGNVAEFAGRG
jgi:hypothetical protein